MANEENQSAPGNLPVGQQLKQAREEKGLSVASVADVQHLRPAIISAIESGHYEQIDTELFLKGYIRAYARQVGLDGSALIADLNAELEPMRQRQAQDKAANPLVDMERRRRKKRRTAKAVLWLIVVAVLVFLVFSFVYSPAQLAGLPGASAIIGSDTDKLDRSERVNTESDNTESDNVEPDQGLDSSDRRSDAAGPEASATQRPNASTMPLAPSSADGVLEPTLAANIGAATVENNAGQEMPSTPAAAVAVNNGAAPEYSEAAPQVAENSGRLEIEFTDDCWIQIRDANGNSLVSGLKRKNDRIDLQTDSNLRLVIGAANAIGTMRFQGEPVDMGSKRVVGNRAEFVLALN